jgi:hypothetical protein
VVGGPHKSGLAAVRALAWHSEDPHCLPHKQTFMDKTHDPCHFTAMQDNDQVTP